MSQYEKYLLKLSSISKMMDVENRLSASDADLKQYANMITSSVFMVMGFRKSQDISNVRLTVPLVINGFSMWSYGLKSDCSVNITTYPDEDIEGQQKVLSWLPELFFESLPAVRGKHPKEISKVSREPHLLYLDAIEMALDYETILKLDMDKLTKHISVHEGFSRQRRGIASFFDNLEERVKDGELSPEETTEIIEAHYEKVQSRGTGWWDPDDIPATTPINSTESGTGEVV